MILTDIGQLHRWCNRNGYGKEFNNAKSLKLPELYRNLFGYAHKPSCPTYGLLPVVSCPGMKKGKNTVCSDCYASRGRYGTESTRRAHIRRLYAFLFNQNLWIKCASGQIMGQIAPYVRLHDSGDFFSPQYVLAWEEVVRRNPEVMFFAPTRSWRVPEILPALRKLNRLPNIAVRPSAVLMDEPTFSVRGLSGAALVTRGEGTCPAVEKRSTCAKESCRMCWEDTKDCVAFRRHR